MGSDKTQAFERMAQQRPKDMVLDYDRVARDNDRLQRDTAERMEAQRREREAARAETREPRAPRQAQMHDKAQDKEGRDKRIDQFYTLQAQAGAGRRALEDGRTTYEQELNRVHRVGRCREGLDYAQRQYDKHAAVYEGFKRDHPVKAALGWEPQIIDGWGNRGSLSDTVARWADHLRDKQSDWARMQNDGQLRQEVQQRVGAHNARVHAAERNLPGIERDLEAARPQHKHDMQARSVEHERERTRSRELDRGMGLGR